MKLSALIQKRENGNSATATPATFATHSRDKGVTVATVAVANPANESVSWRWQIYLNGKVWDAAFSPEATFADVMEFYPAATRAVPILKEDGAWKS